MKILRNLTNFQMSIKFPDNSGKLDVKICVHSKFDQISNSRQCCLSLKYDYSAMFGYVKDTDPHFENQDVCTQ